MGKSNCNEKVEVKKGPWTREEDQKLIAYIQEHGHGSWRSLPAKAGLERYGKSCRMRWTNYLRPDIKRGKFSTQEEKTIIRLHALLGNRWSVISTHLPNRTDNEIKNYWNTRLKKRLTRMGIDPATHKPKNNPNGSAHSKQAANLSHMSQWETARLEAEARLVRESKRLYNIQRLHKFTSPTPLPPLLRAAPPCLDIFKVWLANNNHTGFFGSTCTLESPTSAFSFPGNNSTVPTVHGSLFMANDVMPMTNFNACDQVAKGNSYNQMKGKMENTPLVHDNNQMKGKLENTPLVHDNNVGNPFYYDYSILGSIDYPSVHDNYDTDNLANDIMGGFEDTRNYWNELLNLVNSPKADFHMF